MNQVVSWGLKKKGAEDNSEPVGLMLDKSEARQLIPFTAANTPHDFRIVSEPSLNVQWLGCRLPSLPNLHFIAFPVLNGQTITNNNPFSPLFEITDYPDPPGVVFVTHVAHANQSWSHAGHTSVTHTLTKAHAKKSLNHVPQWRIIP